MREQFTFPEDWLAIRITSRLLTHGRYHFSARYTVNRVRVDAWTMIMLANILHNYVDWRVHYRSDDVIAGSFILTRREVTNILGLYRAKSTNGGVWLHHGFLQ